MSFALLCPGQGAQHPGMLNIAAHHAMSAEVLRAATAALGEDLHAWLADPVLFFENARAQPLVCISQLAWWAALREQLPTPIAFAGYSVGELAAYAVADALDAAALAQLARERARLMEEAVVERGGLIALRGISRRTTADMCDRHGAFIAISMDEDAYVIGGTQSRLDAVAEAAVRFGAEITCLRVGVASHTPLLATAATAFRVILEGSSLQAPARPVVAGVDGSWVLTRERAIDVLSKQIARTIEWSRCIDALYERGCRVFLELGPGAALSRMVRKRLHRVEARSVDEFRAPAAVAAWVARSVARTALRP
ncbi:MAG TPA: acyltransferase domain-containing protein [Casimicrobiaceae bacterium]